MTHRLQHSSTRLGLILSIACAVHCVATPFLIMAFPIISEGMLHHPLVEWSFLVVLVGLGALSLNHYRKAHHNKMLPTWIFVAGALLFFSSLLMQNTAHHVFTIAGSLVIAISHGLNLTMKRTVSSVA